MSAPGRAAVSRSILAILVFSFTGTAAELVLAKHYDTAWKVLPLALFGLGLVAVGAAQVRPGRGTIGALRGIMGLFIISGLAGVILHYKGKAEFALERNQSLGGIELLREAVWKGTSPPLLAPGTMIALGLLGLVWASAAAERRAPHTMGENS